VQFGREEYWQSPKEFLLSKKGDCEDFALLTHTLLKMNGIPSFLVSIYSDRFAHTLCDFEDKGGLGTMDRTEVKRYPTRNLYQLF